MRDHGLFGHPKTPPTNDEFDGLSSDYLSDMIISAVEFCNLIRYADDMPFCEEFKPMFEKLDDLIERAANEILLRGDLSEGKASFLVRLVKNRIPDAQLVDH